MIIIIAPRYYVLNIEHTKILIRYGATAKFLGIETRTEYIEVKDDVQFLASTQLFDDEIHNYYKTVREYLQQRGNLRVKFEIISWTDLASSPQWQRVEETIIYLKTKGTHVADSGWYYCTSKTSSTNKKLMKVRLKKKKRAGQTVTFSFKKPMYREKNVFDVPILLRHDHNTCVERLFSLTVAQ